MLQRGNGLILKEGRFRLDIRKWVFLCCCWFFLIIIIIIYFFIFYKGSEGLERVARGGGGCLVPGDILGHDGGALSNLIKL